MKMEGSGRTRDPGAALELIKRLEKKLLPLPDTDTLMSSTEFTVGEWKLYLAAEGLPEWKQPAHYLAKDRAAGVEGVPLDFEQTDEHPLVCVTWDQARDFCDWLSKKTGREWRLPNDAEWKVAAGDSKYYWGDIWPPKYNFANVGVNEKGQADKEGGRRGVDGILGTAPVASFPPNRLGFYDMAGNVNEWMWGKALRGEQHEVRGGGWYNGFEHYYMTAWHGPAPRPSSPSDGFRIVRRR